MLRIDEEGERIRAFDGVLRDHKDGEREVLDQEAAAERLETDVARIERDIKRVTSEKDKFDDEIDAENVVIKRLEASKAEAVEDPDAAAKVAELAAQLAKMTEEMEAKKATHDDMNTRAEYSELMSKMLKDSGIKTVIVRKYLHPLRDKQIDALILGCTHYPLLKKVIAPRIGRRVHIIDSSVEVARHLRDLLDGDETLRSLLYAPDAASRFFVSDMPAAVTSLATQIFGRTVHLEKTDV